MVSSSAEENSLWKVGDLLRLNKNSACCFAVLHKEIEIEEAIKYINDFWNDTVNKNEYSFLTEENTSFSHTTKWILALRKSPIAGKMFFRKIKTGEICNRFVVTGCSTKKRYFLILENTILKNPGKNDAIKSYVKMLVTERSDSGKINSKIVYLDTGCPNIKGKFIKIEKE